MALEVGSVVFRTAVPSLVKLLKYEWGLDKTVKQGLTSLEAELRGMQAFLEDVSGMPPDQLSRQVKLLADEVRELCYSMEKHLHSFIARIESTKGGPLSAVSKRFINHEIANYIKQTWVKVKEVRERYVPYPSKSSMESTPMRTFWTPRIFAMYTKESDLVGLAGATDELTKMLSKGDPVSIVGMGGLGKTTLARVVYDKMNGEFDYRAFVPAGRSARAENVLKDIFYELRIEIYGGAPNERQLMEQLHKFLVDKRHASIDRVRADLT